MKDTKNVVALISVVVTLILGCIFYFGVETKGEPLPNNGIIGEIKTESESKLSCKYSNIELRDNALKYFTSINGVTSKNGEYYTADIDETEGTKLYVIISHLQVDHKSTDATYIIDCLTGIGTDGQEGEIDFSK